MSNPPARVRRADGIEYGTVEAADGLRRGVLIDESDERGAFLCAVPNGNDEIELIETNG